MKSVHLSHDAHLNLQKLVETRMLLQANSGGGKSWAIRRILEQSNGHVQQIVLDVEDEFYTLREEFDYILVRRDDGDCVPEVRSAGLLARRLLELGVSAIISIYEMKHHERIGFVKNFLDALVNAPKTLWHPVLVFVDEAHIFCPEKGKAESAGSVIDLMTRGRKRGFAGILATQRLSKLNKDAAAEANNKLIGRAAIDVDMKRASEELGFTSKEDMLSLRTLKPGEFYVFGPAISDSVKQTRIGDVKTTHPKAGAAQVPIAPPKHKVLSLLSKLGDLPKEAHEELVTNDQLRREVTQLRRELTQTKNAQPKVPEPKIERVEVPVLTKEHISRLETVAKLIVSAAADGSNFANQILGAIRNKTDLHERLATATLMRPPNTPVPLRRAAAVSRSLADAPSSNGDSPSGGIRRIMVALAQRSGLSAKQVGVRAGLSSSSGTFGTYLGRLRSNGWIEGDRNSMQLTDAGAEALGHYDPLPEGQALYEHWRSELGNGGASRILQVLFESHPNALTKEEVGERANISPTSGTFGTYLGKLRTLELITGRGELKASDEFFE